MPQQPVNFTPKMEQQYETVREAAVLTNEGAREVGYSHAVRDALHVWAEEVRAGTATLTVNEIKAYLAGWVTEIYVDGAPFVKHTVYLAKGDYEDLETLGDYLAALPDYALPNLTASKAKYNNTLIIALALRKRYEQLTAKENA